jgi:pimeloyl-ACP methyl ester carboxylesterase
MLRTIAILAAALAATPALAQMEHHHLPRPDGSAIAYSIDAPTDPTGILVLVQGSGCRPATRNANLATVRAAFPKHLTLMVEKYVITPDAGITDGYRDCPPAFHTGHTVTQHVTDLEAVLATLPKDLPVTLFGGSEGGLAVAILAARVEPHAAIILSSATGIPFTDMVLSTIPPEGQDQVRAGLAAAAADPQGTALFAGSSHRFWADIMQHIPADYMLASTARFLVIQGGLDKSSPVAAARATADRFAAEGRCTLTYWEFPALDHGMLDPAGQSHLPEIATAAATWATTPPTGC